MAPRSSVPADRFLPTSADEIADRGWKQPDVVFVSGDAYVDHPSFAAAILGRVLEAEGFRVAILPQPDWRNADAWRELGAPRLFYAVSAGNMDSMINHYTANRKRRNDDAYSPGGAIGLRPGPRHERLRTALPRGLPRASRSWPAAWRRRCAGSRTTTTGRTPCGPRSWSTSKADLLGYGMGEKHVIVEIARRLAAASRIASAARPARRQPTCWARSESRCADFHRFDARRGDATRSTRARLRSMRSRPTSARSLVMTRGPAPRDQPAQRAADPQRHGDRTLVVNPPALPLPDVRPRWTGSTGCPTRRRAHPSYRARSPPTR